MAGKDYTRHIRIAYDYSQVKEGVTNTRQEMRILNNEMGAAMSMAKRSGNVADEYRVKQDYLTQSLQMQQSELAKNTERYTQAVEKHGEASDSAKRYANAVRESESQISKTNAELTSTQIELAKTGEFMGHSADQWKHAGREMQAVGSGLTRTFTVPFLAISAGSYKAAADFEQAFAGVRKTVEMTDEQAEKVSLAFRKMSTEIPSSAVEIAAVAETAGQLGIAVDDLIAFTRVAIDMGNATQMTSEESAVAMARLSNIMQSTAKYGTESYSMMGSAIVDLGNNLATTEGEILDMSLRLAAAGHQAGMTEADVLGISGALSSVGVQAQAGGSSISKLIINMAVAAETGSAAKEKFDEMGYSIRDLQMMASHERDSFKALAEEMGLTAEELKKMVNSAADLENFGKAAGVSGKQFEKAFREDATGALLAFIQGLQEANKEGDGAIKILNDMGIKEVRMRASILGMVSAADLLPDALERSNAAFEENNALQHEAEQKYKTTASQMAIQKNRIVEAGIALGQQLLPLMVKLTSAIASIAEWFGNLSDPGKKVLLVMGGILAVVGPLLSGLGSLGHLIGGLSALHGLWAAKALAASAANAAAGATAAGAGAGFTSMVGPILAVVAALILLVGLFALLRGKSGSIQNELSGITNSANGLVNSYRRLGSGRSFAVGTNYLAETQVAVVHRGEAIIPAESNPWNPNATSPYGGGGGDTFNLNVKLNEVDEVYKLVELMSWLKQSRRAQYGHNQV